MRKKNGIIFGVCETVGENFGIEPWILRVICVLFFDTACTIYLFVAVVLIFMEHEEDGDNKIKKHKNPKKAYDNNLKTGQDLKKRN